jgi:hypothetical protein
MKKCPTNPFDSAWAWWGLVIGFLIPILIIWDVLIPWSRVISEASMIFLLWVSFPFLGFWIGYRLEVRHKQKRRKCKGR